MCSAVENDLIIFRTSVSLWLVPALFFFFFAFFVTQIELFEKKKVLVVIGRERGSRLCFGLCVYVYDCVCVSTL